MRSALWLCLAVAASAMAQSGQPAGVTSEWDVRKLLENLDLQTQHLRPIMSEVKPEAWIAKGAPETYQVQWKTAQAEINYFLGSSDTLSKQPDRVTLVMDTFFRMQALDSTLSSLTEGVRKYQSPELADQIQMVVAENSTNRDQLRQYMQDLAAQKEQEFKVADREAQRCRGALVETPQPAPKSRRTARP